MRRVCYQFSPLCDIWTSTRVNGCGHGTLHPQGHLMLGRFIFNSPWPFTSGVGISREYLTSWRNKSANQRFHIEKLSRCQDQVVAGPNCIDGTVKRAGAWGLVHHRALCARNLRSSPQAARACVCVLYAAEYVWLYAEKYERVAVFYMLRSRSLALLHSHRFFIPIQSFRLCGELSIFQSPKLKNI